MNTRFPVAPAAYSSLFINQLLQSLRGYLGLAISQDEEAPRVILRSPNGTLYDVRVDDAGALVVTPTEKSRV